MISKSSSLFINPDGIVPSPPITISITVNFMFHSFSSLTRARSRYLSLFSLSVDFTLWSAGKAKSTIRQVLYYYYSFREFFTSALADGFHWSLSDRKSPQVSRTLLSIQAVFNNAVVWMVSSRPPTSKSSRPFSNPLVTVPKAPIKTGTIITFMFHSFFNSLARSRFLSFFSHSFSFIL